MFDGWKKRLRANAGPSTSARPVERLEAGTPLYFMPVPQQPVALSSTEVQLVEWMQHATTVSQLLSRAGLDDTAGRAALRVLLDKGVLTTSMGRAGDAWRWRALLPHRAPGPSGTQSSPQVGRELPPIARAPLTSTPAAVPPVVPPVLERTPTPIPVGAGPVLHRFVRGSSHAQLEALIADTLEKPELDGET